MSDLIVQLDGPAEDSEKEKKPPTEDNDFLGMLSAEAIKAMQEIEESSDDNISSSDNEPDLILVKEEGEEDEVRHPLVRTGKQHLCVLSFSAYFHTSFHTGSFEFRR